jgi:uncharacterized protein YhaN
MSPRRPLRVVKVDKKKGIITVSRKSSALREAEAYIRDLERTSAALVKQVDILRERLRECEEKDMEGGLDS